MNNTISYLAIGSELLDGRCLEKNGNYLAKKLSDAGSSLYHSLTVDDSIEQICSALRFLSKQSSLIIISGGLGPTQDDLTRDAIATYLNTKLHIHEQSLEDMKKFFASRKREFPKVNEKQALIPQQAVIVENSIGTAPGFTIDTQNQNTLFVLPGVPSEFKMMLDYKLDQLLDRYNFKKLHKKQLKIYGYPESGLQELISQIECPQDIELAFQVSFPEINLILKGRDTKQLDSYDKALTDLIGSQHIFARDKKTTYIQHCIERLKQQNLTLACAESCTGGMLGTMITELSGVSDTFMGSAVTYSNQAKIDILNVDPKIIKGHGAVSEQVAIAMAQGARTVYGSDIAVSITGIAGPTGGTDQKPVGTFYTGIATVDKSEAIKHFFPSSREMIRKLACYRALEAISLMGIKI